jgi:16S rRNA G1207 methylase RsmC
MSPFYKKTIPFCYRKWDLSFDVAQSLFSSVAIDHGTQRLLRSLLEYDFTKKSILDMGCGYGPIGISIAKAFPQSNVLATDIDALALTFTKENAKKNNVGIKALESIGFDNLAGQTFDVILSNIPAKIGAKAIEYILLSSKNYLNDKGFVAIVVIDAIAEEVKDILQSDESIKITLQKKWPGHHVFHYEFTKLPQEKIYHNSFNHGVYDRLEQSFEFKNKKLSVKTVYNLPEFDTLDYETDMLLDLLEHERLNYVKSATVLNPGQGYLPLACSINKSIETITLIDRNLLALKTSKRNLLNNKFDEKNILLHHQIDWESETSTDVIIGSIPEKEPREVYAMLLDQAIVQVNSKGYLFLSGSSHTIQEALSLPIVRKDTQLKKLNKYRGKSAVLLQRK